ncbi:MAG: helix-turn-helix domain-containing protein [Lentisphaerae bacterium]|nr:helix-turn-helix domain-containing protein [Lentisphaerota bacterium]
MELDEAKIGAKLRNLRQRSNISLRQLAKSADISVSYISAVEKDQASPTLATLRRILAALGTDFLNFFSEEDNNSEKYVFRKSMMHTVTDRDREYTFILPPRKDIHLELMDENYFPGGELPEFEAMEHDFAGYVISGKIVIEIAGEAPTVLASGDAFHVPCGVQLRGYCTAGNKARLLTIHYPVRQG